MLAEPYRQVLSLPGVGRLTLVAVLVRIPAAASAVTVTLHVLRDLHRGYGAAGAVAAAMTIGTALGAPLLGRMFDRFGARPVLAASVCAEAAFWSIAPGLGYSQLLVFAGCTRLLSLPAYSLVRQALAAMIPAAQRREGYALDSMSVEVSYMVGPTVAIFAVTRISGSGAMFMIGAATVAAGLSLMALNPPTRPRGVPAVKESASSRLTLVPSWWRSPGTARGLIAQLAAAAGATTVISGTEVSLVAELRDVGQLGWTGTVFVSWCACSLLGGFVYGGARRPIAPAALVGLLGLATVPIGAADGWVLLSVALIPAGALCAPTIASSSDAVSRLAPPGASGEFMGWHGSALTAGNALGAPLAGAVVDATTRGMGFAAVGMVGVAVSLPLLVGSIIGKRDVPLHSRQRS